jgi:hypothetical protein
LPLARFGELLNHQVSPPEAPAVIIELTATLIFNIRRVSV